MEIDDQIQHSGNEEKAIDQLSKKLIVFAKVIDKKSDSLSEDFTKLTNSLNENAKSSNRLQEKLIFWTKVMVGAITLQALSLLIETHFIGFLVGWIKEVFL